ncbi:MAG TPA: hypothetical protein VMU39_11510 [Solirubrobacteraceae bacterium]|nr:hypothetical protein [Solirubrobacteraceae bacterium]
MRVEFALAGSGPASPAVSATAARRRLDRFDCGVLLVFSAISVWVLALDLWQVVVHGRVWTGTDGLYLVDQMQYLAWIRDASHHVLASNLFVLRPTAADYFQPAIMISGGLSALGMAPWLSFLLWKPVAVVGFFFAARAYVNRSLPGLWARRAGLVLALFYGSFTLVYGSVSVLGDLFPGFLSWGYVFGLLALAAMTAAFLSYDTARRRGKVSWMPGLLGALAGLMHPWHGELMILVILGGELFMGRTREPLLERARLLVLTVGVAAVPLIYYILLGHADLSWRLARVASRHSFSLWSILLVIVPLLIPAAFAYRVRPRGFLGATTRAWPLACMVVFVLSATALSATPLHAFQGITVPLAVLSIEGIRRFDWGWLRRPKLAAIAAVALATVPATAYELYLAKKTVAVGPSNSTFILPDERRAIDFLQHDPVKGGVLTRSYLGAIVPGRTGRRVFVGDCLWSQPGCYDRTDSAESLFDGLMGRHAARAFVSDSGARFVLADCQATANLRRLLGPMIVGERRFGCAAVYELDAPGPATGPLAESRADAAVRAARRQ